MEESKGNKPDRNDYFEPYAYFARTLRLWFIAYGIGAPFALISNECLWRKIEASGCLHWISLLFLSGVGLQVVMTILWRTSMWYQYIVDEKPKIKGTWYFKASEWLSVQYLLFEIIPDLTTIGFFITATVISLHAACG